MKFASPCLLMQLHQKAVPPHLGEGQIHIQIFVFPFPPWGGKNTQFIFLYFPPQGGEGQSATR